MRELGRCVRACVYERTCVCVCTYAYHTSPTLPRYQKGPRRLEQRYRGFKRCREFTLCRSLILSLGSTLTLRRVVSFTRVAKFLYRIRSVSHSFLNRRRDSFVARRALVLPHYRPDSIVGGSVRGRDGSLPVRVGTLGSVPLPVGVGRVGFISETREDLGS